MSRRPPPKQLTSWSYSRYTTYKQCPRKAKLAFLDKITEPPNQAMARGSEIHKLAEDYIKGKIRAMPAELKLLKGEFTTLRAMYKKKSLAMVVEDSWAFTKTWDRTMWNDWTGCWLRIKLDCAHHLDEDTLVITDWKTGSFRPDTVTDYEEQLELYALGALLLHPHIKEVQPRLAYTDAGKIHPEIPEAYTQADLPKLKKTWEKRVKPMMNDTVFAPRPNDRCKWCFYRRSNAANGGGQCEF